MISNPWLFPASNMSLLHFSVFKRGPSPRDGCWEQGQGCCGPAASISAGGHVHLYALLPHFSLCWAHAHFWVRASSHRSSFFCILPQTPEIPYCVRLLSLNQAQDSVFIIIRCSMDLTQEGCWALPYLKRGRGNLGDKRIYFSTGLFASRACRKLLFKFDQ